MNIELNPTDIIMLIDSFNNMHIIASVLKDTRGKYLLLKYKELKHNSEPKYYNTMWTAEQIDERLKERPVKAILNFKTDPSSTYELIRKNNKNIIPIVAPLC